MANLKLIVAFLLKYSLNQLKDVDLIKEVGNISLKKTGTQSLKNFWLKVNFDLVLN